MRAARHAWHLLLLLVALPALLPGVARAQVSPGPLAAAHRDLDGALSCFQCHPKGGSGTMDQRCLACHGEIGWLRARNRGLHAKVAGQPCARCHPDHAGRDFHLVAWKSGSPETFDHRETGEPLLGKHATLECRACHQPKFQRSQGAALIRVKDRTRTWLGLERDCASCHADPHRAQLGRACRNCHGLESWKPAPGFDHARTRYPLTGRHADVSCAKCHQVEGPEATHDAAGAFLPRYKPLAHAECSACHRDPHVGRFGAACAKCHTTEGFRRVDSRLFDHDRTRYPLRGRHASAACASCHDPKKAWGAKPAFATCGGCHRDAHGGRARLAGKPADCAACHSVDGFASSIFTVAQHRNTAYPLEGRHASARCDACHRVLPPGPEGDAWGTSRTLLAPPHGSCEDCHLDPHRGAFRSAATRERTGACTACHGLEGFRPSRFDVAAHARTRFPLEGAHRATPCQACHTELAARSSAANGARRDRPLVFTIAKRGCADCHRNPHGDQFAARRAGSACETCHGLEAFVPASRFDHGRDTGFKLDGAHARTPCAGCHKTERVAGGATRVLYHPTPSRCESCHSDATRGRTAPEGSHETLH